MRTFTHEEILKYLSENLKGWKYENGTLKREFKFMNFVQAFSFMAAVALEAEKIDHHPDWSNSYNKVSISLRTHSENGITQKDFELADKTGKVYDDHLKSFSG